MNVLVIEDGLVNQRVARDILVHLGHRVQIADNGRDGLKRLEDGTFDLVLMDVQMPEMDGVEAAMEIRRREQQTQQHVAIIAMTANAMVADRERCLAAGMDGFISKPLRIEALKRVIENSRQPHELAQGQPAEVSAGGKACVTMDLDLALQRVGGNPRILEEMVGVFHEEAPVLMAQMKTALETGDLVELQRLAHTMKSSVGMMGGRNAMELCIEIETMARAGQMEQAPHHVKALEIEMEKLTGALKDHFGESSSR